MQAAATGTDAATLLLLLQPQQQQVHRNNYEGRNHTSTPRHSHLQVRGRIFMRNGAVRIGMTAMSIGPVPPARVGKLGAQTAKICTAKACSELYTNLSPEPLRSSEEIESRPDTSLFSVCSESYTDPSQWPFRPSGEIDSRPDTALVRAAG